MVLAGLAKLTVELDELVVIDVEVELLQLDRLVLVVLAENYKEVAQYRNPIADIYPPGFCNAEPCLDRCRWVGVPCIPR